MAFSSTVTSKTNLGAVSLIYGTYTQADGDSGGTITTGFGTVIAFGAMITGQLDATEPKYSESGGTVTLVTGNGVDGSWWAIGK